MENLIGTKVVVDGIIYTVIEQTIMHKNMYVCLNSRDGELNRLVMSDNEILETHEIQFPRPIWHSSDITDPRTYAHLEDILRNILPGCDQQDLVNTYKTSAEKWNIRIDALGSQHIVQGGGIKSFIETFPNALDYFLGIGKRLFVPDYVSYFDALNAVRTEGYVKSLELHQAVVNSCIGLGYSKEAQDINAMNTRQYQKLIKLFGESLVS